MKILAILTSMPFESGLLREQINLICEEPFAGGNMFTGELCGRPIVLVHTGIGKINAAHAATIALERHQISTVINAGIAGAYTASGLRAGDIALATMEILADDGVITSAGFLGMETIGIPVVQTDDRKYFNDYPLELIPEMSSAFPGRILASGHFLTVSAASGDAARADLLAERFTAICENMEGAAIAQVCAMYEIPMYAVRGISNIAGDRNKTRWDLKGASEHCQQFVLQLAKQIK
ncbi:MAG: futalosine hydrolase [Nitrospira sp.]|nr:futalosine hydrolase [bacterium]MBL7049101.1 futalosine hydrolase [Nitrospira sp.]